MSFLDKEGLACLWQQITAKSKNKHCQCQYGGVKCHVI